MCFVGSSMLQQLVCKEAVALLGFRLIFLSFKYHNLLIMYLRLINGDQDDATGGADAWKQQAGEEGAGAIVANDQPDGKFYPSLYSMD